MGKYITLAAFSAILLTYNLAQVVRWIHMYVVEDGAFLALLPALWHGVFLAVWGFLLSVYLREIDKRY